MSDETIASLARSYILAREARKVARARRAESMRALHSGGCEGDHQDEHGTEVLCFRRYPMSDRKWCDPCKTHQTQKHAEYQRAATAVGSLLRRLTLAVGQESEGVSDE